MPIRGADLRKVPVPVPVPVRLDRHIKCRLPALFKSAGAGAGEILDSIGTESAGAGADFGADIGSGTSTYGTDAGSYQKIITKVTIFT